MIMTNDTNRIISKLLSLIDVTCCHYSLIVYNPTTGTVRGSKDTVSKTDTGPAFTEVTFS